MLMKRLNWPVICFEFSFLSGPQLLRVEWIFKSLWAFFAENFLERSMRPSSLNPCLNKSSRNARVSGWHFFARRLFGFLAHPRGNTTANASSLSAAGISKETVGARHVWMLVICSPKFLLNNFPAASFKVSEGGSCMFCSMWASKRWRVKNNLQHMAGKRYFVSSVFDLWTFRCFHTISFACCNSSREITCSHRSFPQCT